MQFLAVAGSTEDTDEGFGEDTEQVSIGSAPPGAQAVPLQSPEGYMCEPTAGLGPPRQDAAPGRTPASDGMDPHVCSWDNDGGGRTYCFIHGYHRCCVQEGASRFRMGKKHAVVSWYPCMHGPLNRCQRWHVRWHVQPGGC